MLLPVIIRKFKLACANEMAWLLLSFPAIAMLAAMIPGARFVALEGRNHLILENEPAWPRFIEEVRKFLATVDCQ